MRWEAAADGGGGGGGGCVVISEDAPPPGAGLGHMSFGGFSPALEAMQVQREKQPELSSVIWAVWSCWALWARCNLSGHGCVRLCMKLLFSSHIAAHHLRTACHCQPQGQPGAACNG